MKKLSFLTVLLTVSLSCSKKEPLPDANQPPELFIRWETDRAEEVYQVTENGVQAFATTVTPGFGARYYVFTYSLDPDNFIQLVFNNYSSMLSTDTTVDMKRTFTEGVKPYNTSGFYAPDEVSIYIIDVNERENSLATVYPKNKSAKFEITQVEEVIRVGRRYLKVEYAFEATVISPMGSKEVILRNGSGAASFPLPL